MSTRILPNRLRFGLSALLVTCISGLATPFTPVAEAASAAGTVELDPTPPNLTGVPPNIVVTFDDSGSMAWDYMSDTPPFGTSSGWSSGPWYCAGVIDPTATSGIGTHAMNGVYYNPNVYYKPALKADSTSFPQGDITLKNVENDGIAANRPISPGSIGTTDFTGAKTSSGDARWKCSYGGTSPIAAGGPYYYKYTGPALAVDSYGNPTSASVTNLYTKANWTGVSVTTAALVINGVTIKDANGNTVTQYQNWANWWAYYHFRNLMARTALTRVFGDSKLAATTSGNGFGSSIRVAWQNLYTTDLFNLPSSTIISSLIDTTPSTCASSEPTLGSASQITGTVTTAPACYRSDFFNWIFQVGATSGTPTRSATVRAGDFFKRSGSKNDLHDPYWRPSSSGTGNGIELTCQQNFHILMTDGLWNGGSDGPLYANLTLPSTVGTLPDGVSFPSTSSGVTSIYAPQHDAGETTYASLSDIAFHYWATNLRPDLYTPASGKFVPPYLPDTTTSVFNLTGTSGSSVPSTNINQEMYFNPANDPATWPHMSEYLIGLGVSGVLNLSTNTDCTDTSGAASDACNLRKGQKNSSGNVGWPSPNGSGSGIAANIDDTWHAALAGRGQFFSAGNPQNLIDQLTGVLATISGRSIPATIGAVNATVLTLGAVTFNTGYSSVDWSGVLQAVTLNTDGTAGSMLWDAGAKLNSATIAPANRVILTASMDSSGNIAGMAFESGSAFDSTETAGLTAPAASDTTNDTLANRVNYLRGVRTEETAKVMRLRNQLLGAILDAQPVFVSYPSSGYNNSWPSNAAEAQPSAETYDDFVSKNINRPGTVYMAANDGMLHAFDASLVCNPNTPPKTGCASYGPAQSATAGQERWAYVPRAVYGNLGNLTSKASFTFQQTVNATPVTRDVFFSSDNSWHTILVGALRLGGRGVYALDITNPTSPSESTPKSTVLWEFDSDTAKTSAGDPSNLGYTYGQPNIGRLANGKWVVLVPGGYFPDCSQIDKPANCQTIAASSNGYSSLFVLDAQTGQLIQEVKTPTTATVAGTSVNVTSYGLSSPVLGDYNNDQIDDVAFAGDLVGNLWRFDLSDSTNPANWKATLAFQPATQGAQPITVMPRLFPDATTNRFIVVFGTGQYLGAGDNTTIGIQSVYGIRDKVDSSGNSVTITKSTLQAQTLGETAINSASSPYNGATLRTLTNNTVSASKDGWYFDLNTMSGSTQTDAGERVVVTAGAIFSTNTAVISTLIPGSADPCNPSILGAVMLINASTGAPSTVAAASIGGTNYVGGRVNNVRTSGTVPVTTSMGGGMGLLPGMTLTGVTNGTQGITPPLPIWRRRAWSEINP